MKIAASRLKQIIKEEAQKLLCEAEKWTELGGYGQALANRHIDPDAPRQDKIDARGELFAKYPGYNIKFDKERNAWVGSPTPLRFHPDFGEDRGWLGSFQYPPKVDLFATWGTRNPSPDWTYEIPKVQWRRGSEPEERATGAKIPLPPHRAAPRSLDEGHEEKLKKLDPNKLYKNEI